MAVAGPHHIVECCVALQLQPTEFAKFCKQNLPAYSLPLFIRSHPRVCPACMHACVRVLGWVGLCVHVCVCTHARTCVRVSACMRACGQIPACDGGDGYVQTQEGGVSRRGL